MSINAKRRKIIHIITGLIFICMLFTACRNQVADEASDETIYEENNETVYETQDEQNIIWSSSAEYPTVAKIENLTFFMDEDFQGLQIKEELEAFIEYATQARNTINEYFRESGADQYISEDSFDHKRYTIFEAKDGTCYTNGYTIHMINDRPGTWAHEYTHTMVLNADKWYVYQEGIAEYLGRILVEDPFYYNMFWNMLKTAAESEDEIIHSIAEAYEEKYELPETAEEFEYQFFGILIAKLSLNPDISNVLGASSLTDPLYIRYNVRDEDFRKEGDELSYWQAGIFVAYLSETYGFDKVVKAYLNSEAFEESYGKTYEELKADWIEWLSDVCPSVCEIYNPKATT